MNPSPVTKKDLIKYGFLSLLIILLIFFIQTSDNQTKIIFCDIGQGDATYIRVKNKVDILIDAGPSKKVLNCLGKYMPFWDRKIELAILSHHDKDHYGGFLYLINRYKIDKFLTIDYRFDSKTYQDFKNKLEKTKTIYQTVYQGNNFLILKDNLRFYWPPLDIKSNDSNDYSLIFLFEEGSFKALFTGDASPKILNLIVGNGRDRSLHNVDILKIPHHGSRNGLTKNFLELADPKIAVISVGKNNSYGHPSKVVLDMLEAKKVDIRRTDVDGNIVFRITNNKL